MKVTASLDPAAKAIGDVTSFAIVAGALVKILPALAALLTVIWTSLRIYETVLTLRDKRRRNRGP